MNWLYINGKNREYISGHYSQEVSDRIEWKEHSIKHKLFIIDQRIEDAIAKRELNIREISKLMKED